MSVSINEATRRRLEASKKEHAESDNLSILDMLAVPKNMEDLEMQITDASDCRMFFPMKGLPRAYMEIPILMEPDPAKVLAKQVWGTPDIYYERWVYVVFGFFMRGTQAKSEPRICEKFWQLFLELRKDFAKRYGDTDPLLIWRRGPEISEVPVSATPCFEHGKKRCRKCSGYTKATMRFAIPGLDLRTHPLAWNDGQPMSPKHEIKPEVVV